MPISRAQKLVAFSITLIVSIGKIFGAALLVTWFLSTGPHHLPYGPVIFVGMFGLATGVVMLGWVVVDFKNRSDRVAALVVLVSVLSGMLAGLLYGIYWWHPSRMAELSLLATPITIAAGFIGGAVFHLIRPRAIPSLLEE